MAVDMLGNENHIEILQSLQQIYGEQRLYAFKAKDNILTLTFNSNVIKDSEFIENEIKNAIKRQETIIKYFDTQIITAEILEKYRFYNAKNIG